MQTQERAGRNKTYEMNNPGSQRSGNPNHDQTRDTEPDQGREDDQEVHLLPRVEAAHRRQRALWIDHVNGDSDEPENIVPVPFQALA